MSKIKTVRSVKKRFNQTSSGGFKYKHANTRHILTKKSTKRKRHLRKKSMISKKNLYSVLRCLS